MKVSQFRRNAGVVEAGTDGMGRLDLAVPVLEEIGQVALDYAGTAVGAEPHGM